MSTQIAQDSQSETLDKQQETRDSNGKLIGGITGKGFVAGKSGNPKGRLPDTPEQKAVKKLVKEYVADYEQGLAESLPEIQPVLIDQAMKGNIKAFGEIHKVLGAHKNTGNTMVVGVKIDFKDKEYE